MIYSIPNPRIRNCRPRVGGNGAAKSAILDVVEEIVTGKHRHIKLRLTFLSTTNNIGLIRYIWIDGRLKIVC